MNILLVCPDQVGPEMAGVGIRYRELAHSLSAHHKVTLSSPKNTLPDSKNVTQIEYRSGSKDIENILPFYDLVVVQAFSFQEITNSNINSVFVVVDLYCPNYFENAISDIYSDIGGSHQYRADIDLLRTQLKLGDFFLCANSHQKDMIIGMLTLLGRVSKQQLITDISLDKLIGVVPFGTHNYDTFSKHKYVYEIHTQLTVSDRVFVWGGGIHNWLDAETPIKAMSLLRFSHPHIKLLFAASIGHPGQARGSEATLALALSHEMGLKDANVFFLEQWSRYSERSGYLNGATAGLVCHRDHVETRFAFRTRVLDYLWAGLPIVTSDGDEFADLVRKFDLGIVVPPGDPQALADAFVTLVERIDAGEHVNDRIASIRPLYHWDEVVKPLLEFCANPRKTAHLGDPVLMAGLPDVMTPRREVSRLLYRAMTVLRSEGPKIVVRKVARKMLTLLRRARSN